MEASYLLIAGTEWETEATTLQPTMEMLLGEPYSLISDYGVVIQYHAHSTIDQTAWVVEQVKNKGITSLSLVATTYHLVRAYLTLLKEFRRKNVPWIPIIPLPAPKDPGAIVPEDGVDAWQLFDGEVARIEKYQGPDFQNVATLPELKEYLTWLYQQPLLQE